MHRTGYPMRVGSLLLVLATLSGGARAFAVSARSSIPQGRTHTTLDKRNGRLRDPFSRTLEPFSILRPTASLRPSKTALSMLPVSSGTVRLLLTSSLQSGPWGVLGLWAIASAVIIPCTLYRQGYCFSVGYGYSISVMASILAKVFGMSPLLAAAMFYGNRLGTFLWMRLVLVPSKAEQMKATDKSPPLQRLPFGAAVALFYALLMTPALYAMRRVPFFTTTFAGKLLFRARQVGTVLAWTGAILEAIADGQKFMAKRRQSNDDVSNEKKTFAGPTEGVYRITRHPNYTGEVLFWGGMLISGIPSFGSSAIAWICSLLGFYGIYGIMINATKRLDQRQQEAYGGEESYDTWRANVKAPIFPFVKGE